MAWVINGLFDSKAIPAEEQMWFYLIYNWWGGRVHTFPKSINPKVIVIAPLAIELAYIKAADQHFNQYATGTLPSDR